MSAADLMHGQDANARRNNPKHLGALALALIALELMTILLLLPTLSVQVDKVMSASPLARPNMRSMTFAIVLLFLPLLKVMAAALWSLLVNSLRQLCHLNGNFVDYAFAIFTAALVLGVGRLVNTLLTASTGGSYLHDHFALGTLFPALLQHASWFARLGFWDLVAFAVFASVIRARSTITSVVALAFGTISWLVPLLAFYRIQEIMGR